MRARSASAILPCSSSLASCSFSLSSCSSCKMRLTSRSRMRCSRVIMRDCRSSSSLSCLSCSLCAISKSARRFRSCASASSTAFCFSILSAMRLDLLAVASFCKFSSSLARRAASRARSSARCSMIGMTCASSRLRSSFSFGSLLLRILSINA